MRVLACTPLSDSIKLGFGDDCVISAMLRAGSPFGRVR